MTTYVDTPTSRCRAGVARCDVTPPVGIYHRMWGAATHDRATGVHRPLTAAVLLLEPLEGTDQGQVLIAIDHCIFWAREMDDMLCDVSGKTGVDPQRITFCFSHTHSAGLMGVERASLPGGDLIAPYMKELAGKIAGLIEEARRNLEPVTISYGQGRCSMAGQRDFWDEQTKQFVCGFNPKVRADDTVLVGRVSGTDGKTRATLVNYACHPTSLAWANTLISPDFVGALREVVERDTGAPCLFFQGASGDLGPRDGFVGDVAVADRNGKQLGHAALEAIVSLPTPGTRFVYTGPVVSGATLGAWKHRPLDAESLQAKGHWHIRRFQVPLTYRPELPTRANTEAELGHWQAEEEKAQRAGNTLAARDAHAMCERMTRILTRLVSLPPGDRFPLEVRLLRMGDAIWLAVEAEHYQYLQIKLRQRFPGMPLVIITIANGSRCVYLPTAETYGRGIYQESIALLAPGCLEELTEVLAGEIGRLGLV